jgi:acetoacetate decarboxylase
VLIERSPALRGGSPPFTPSGRAGHGRAIHLFETGEVNRVGHRGLLLRWRADRAIAEGLLPKPLQAVSETDQIAMWLTQVQAARSEDYLYTENPQMTNWHEALFLIPCAFNGVRGAFTWARYQDVDQGVTTGIYRGAVTKQGQFFLSYPFRGQPLNREMTDRGAAHAVVSRYGERIIRAAFSAKSELPQEGILNATGLSLLSNQIGVRFMPDWATVGGQALVHDLVSWNLSEVGVVRAWAGRARLWFGEAEDEELNLLAPVGDLESYFLYFNYVEGPNCCRLLHDYVDRTGANGPSLEDPEPWQAPMGGRLKGVTPPFTFSGMAALGRSTWTGGLPGTPLGQAGHYGIYVRWRADRKNVESLLPWPLEPAPDSDQINLFLNQTQSGINRFRRLDSDPDSMEYLNEVAPHHSNWHECLFRIPCLYRGTRMNFIILQYKDRDHSVELGMYNGFVTKVASFHENFPMIGSPLFDEMAPGRVAHMTMSRFDQRILTARFEATHEVAQADIADAIDMELMKFNVGTRYFPDYANPGGPPLEHSLISRYQANRIYPRVWAGKAEISFRPSDTEELDLLEPIEMLPSTFCYLEYQGGPGRTKLIHDYLSPEAAD